MENVFGEYQKVEGKTRRKESGFDIQKFEKMLDDAVKSEGKYLISKVEHQILKKTVDPLRKVDPRNVSIKECDELRVKLDDVFQEYRRSSIEFFSYIKDNPITFTVTIDPKLTKIGNGIDIKHEISFDTFDITEKKESPQRIYKLFSMLYSMPLKTDEWKYSNIQENFEMSKQFKNISANGEPIKLEGSDNYNLVFLKYNGTGSFKVAKAERDNGYGYSNSRDYYNPLLDESYYNIALDCLNRLGNKIGIELKYVVNRKGIELLVL